MSKLNRRPYERTRNVDRIFTLDEFAKLNRISTSTLERTIARGEGPKLVQLSLRRLGIRERDGAAWQAAHVLPRKASVKSQSST